MAGLTSTGLEIKTLDEILEEIGDSLQEDIDPDLDVTPESVVGQIIGVFAERERTLWELLRAVWQAFTPGGASGVSLTQLSLITGTIRRDATYSTVEATVNLNATTTLPAGSRANVIGDPSSVFETLADAVNAGGSPADVLVQMRAVESGPVRANAGTLEEITTAVVGWNTVTNVLDADMGEGVELDPDLRVRRENEIRIQGSSNIDALAANVDTVDDVIDVAGFEDLVAHTFQIVVWDGDPPAADDDEIAQAIWDKKPAGIESTGAESGTALDAQGNDQIIAFDRATPIEMYFEVDLTVDPDTYPVDGDDQVKEAIVAYGDENYAIGSDVVPSALYGAIHAISGVISIDEIRLDDSASPLGTALFPIGSAEIARNDTSRILVAS